MDGHAKVWRNEKERKLCDYTISSKKRNNFKKTYGKHRTYETDVITAKILLCISFM